MTRRGGILMMAVAAMSLAPLALAQSPRARTQPKSAAPDPATLLAGLPADAEAAVMVCNAAAQRRTAAGQSLAQLLTDARTLPRTAAAWERLASTLGWTPEQAFDEILGRRITLIARDLSGRDPQWALLSDVNAATERRLRERLMAVPRGTKCGLPVLAVEDGNFELTIARTFEGSAGAPSDAIIILSPRGRSTLLAEEVAVCDYVRGPRRVSAQSSEVAVSFRSAAGAEMRTLTLTASAQAKGWRGNLVCSPGLVWALPAHAAAIEPWSDGPFRALGEDSLLAVMGVIGSAPLEGVSSIPGVQEGVQAWLPAVPAALTQQATGRKAALVVRRVGPARAQTSRALVASTPSLGGAPTAQVRTSLACTMAVEAPGPHGAMLEGDRAIASLLMLFHSGLESSGAAPLRLEVGIPDDLPRRLRLADDLEIAPELRDPLERAFGPSAELSWGPCGPGAAWWTATLAPGEARPTERALAALPGSRGRDGEPRRRYLSIGVVRPADLRRLLGDLAPGLPSPGPAARWLEMVRWSTWLRDDGLVEAEIEVRMAP
jgi:hypothetical protein